ncbi:bifunctional folylpolyglutamate synthase/dihydrofolate synthase [Rubricoccus marinus]|uniref:Dihydrofolate synthase/folylpolyglutamate synthase n=1 Tax=Rubricoccus marinus TaxID=716817 RepID=A0A259TVU4_9BACT|nr:folylpolyglutamate synthase/dihydrofolate synthase family protein [Rubricoccus marinus]OZC01853.1 hypothetical protein BSZ36_01920 [Rubricoccus marinus]
MSAEAFLLGLPRFAASGASAYAPGLGRIRALLAAMGDPHRGLRVVHVAGTNGKGSTSSFAAALLASGGLRVGLHTSPHLLHLRERMRVNGVPASGAWLDAAVESYKSEMREIGPSFFEATVALSLLYFAEQRVDVAVVEVGLGGRLDATNVIEPLAALVTHIGLDHTDLLGDTPEAIAREKAGIAKPGAPFLHALPAGPTRDALEAEARRRGATPEAVRDACRVSASGADYAFTTPEASYSPVGLGLSGAHQAWNAALALRAAEIALGGPAPLSGLRDVVALTGLRGRAEVWSEDPRVVLDVAHNPDGWRAALDAVPGAPGAHLWVLAGVMADKDVEGLGDLLAARGARVLALGLEGERALGAEPLAERLRACGAEVETAASVEDALDRFRREGSGADRLLVTGSHVTVSDVLKTERTSATPGG